MHSLALERLHSMTTKQTIERLKPLRADVSAWHTRILDHLQTGVTAEQCQGRFDTWRQAVRDYLAALKAAEVDTQQVRRIGRELRAELDATPVTDRQQGLEAWKDDKEYEDLLASYQVACDLNAGYRQTQDWLTGIKHRLELTIQRRANPEINAAIYERNTAYQDEMEADNASTPD